MRDMQWHFGWKKQETALQYIDESVVNMGKMAQPLYKQGETSIEVQGQESPHNEDKKSNYTKLLYFMQTLSHFMQTLSYFMETLSYFTQTPSFYKQTVLYFLQSPAYLTPFPEC